MSRLINDLINEGYLKTNAVIDAFRKINRIEFVPEKFKEKADENIPLPIGFGQTISQPLTVAFMFELLELKKGQNILDVGSGSGWTTALLSEIVGPRGKVSAIERIPELCQWGEKNADKFNFVKDGRAQFHCLDGSEGFPANAPYDRILVSAMAQEVPIYLKEQLKIGGKMVIPVQNSIWQIEKRKEEDFYKKEYPGFLFVPLIQKS